jgi:nucleotide sugar dehydrogenase
MNKIAIVGIGRLGLCFALNLERIGYSVFGIDTNKSYIEQIQLKQLKSNEPLVEEYLKESKNFIATTDLSIIEKENIQFIYLILPTPSTNDGTFSHTFIDDFFTTYSKVVTDKVKRHIIIGSTVMPGYCDDLADRYNNISITYNPEFIAQGSIIHDQQHPDQILIGEGNEEATLFLKELYSKMCASNPAIHVMSRKSAEITKLATNCYLTMKISFANSIGDLARTVGAEEEKILNAIGSDSRIGNKYLKYGFGFGGPCFPRDNQALLAYSKDVQATLPLSVATVQVNKEHLVFQLKELLKKESHIYYFDSVTYKKDTDILEASQQLELAKLLVENGKKVIIKNSMSVRKDIESLFPSYFIFED